MNISGIRPSIGFYDQNSIKIDPELATNQVEEVTSELATGAEISSTSVLSDEEIAAARSGQTFGSYDFASQYKPGSQYELKGVDSDIKSLDVEKAVSNMQKDSAIHRYQYFVQNKPKTDGVAPQVRGTEDFSL